MRRITLLASSLVIGLVALGGLVWSVLQPAQPPAQEAWSVAQALRVEADAGYQRATSVREWSFPADHGPHPGFKIEWWYYTGSLASADGRQWGYELTFFRQALTPKPAERSTAWATSELYLAHFTLSDLAGQQFYTAERLVRGGALGQGGAEAVPFRVWAADWSTSGTAEQAHLVAQSDSVALALDVAALKPPTLQGEQGLSRKNSSGDAASYYYSLTRMQTTGTITVAGQSFAVTGLSWFDREWSSGTLGADQIGWDWFGLHLDDGRDLMLYDLHRPDGSISYIAGSLTDANARVTQLSTADVRMTSQGWWTSPDGARYPLEWRIEIPSQQIDITVTALMQDQELRLRSARYWEGAMAVSGTHTGSGYLEMTSYTATDAVPQR